MAQANPGASLLRKKKKLGDNRPFYRDLEGNPTKPFQRSARLKAELASPGRSLMGATAPQDRAAPLISQSTRPFYRDLEGNPTKPFQRSKLAAEGKRTSFPRKQVGGLGNSSIDVFGGMGLKEVSSPSEVKPSQRVASKPVAPGTAQKIDLGHHPLRDADYRAAGTGNAEFEPKADRIFVRPDLQKVPLPARSADPKMKHPTAGRLPDPSGRSLTMPSTVEQIRPPQPIKGYATYQEQLDKVFGDIGKKAPRATAEQEAAFKKRQAEKDAIREKSRGKVTIGGRRGGEITIRSDQIGTREGKIRATTARIRFGEATGENKIRIGNQNFMIPAHIDPQDFSEHVTGYLQGTEGNLIQMSISDAVKESLDDFSRASGIPTSGGVPSIRVAGDGSLRSSTREGDPYMPIDFRSNEGARIRAQREAERTGKAVQADVPSSGINLATFMLPSEGKRKEVKKALIAEAKAEASAAAALVKEKAAAKAVGARLKEIKGFFKATGGVAKGKAVDTFIDSFVEGETVGSGDDTYFKPGKGPLFHARKTDKNPEGKKIKGGIIQPYEINAEGLEDLWIAVQKQFGKHIPASVLAYRMSALFGRHSEWDQDVVNSFMRKHKEAFRTQLSKPVPVPVSEAEFTELFEWIYSGVEPTPEMEATYKRMSEKQKADLAEQLKMNKDTGDA